MLEQSQAEKMIEELEDASADYYDAPDAGVSRVRLPRLEAAREAMRQALTTPQPAENFPDALALAANAALPTLMMRHFETGFPITEKDTCEEAYDWAAKMAAARKAVTP